MCIVVGDGIISLCDDSFDDSVIYVGTVYLNVKKEEEEVKPEEAKENTVVDATPNERHAIIKEEHPNQTAPVKQEADVKIELMKSEKN